jgi:hypothetical protein
MASRGEEARRTLTDDVAVGAEGKRAVRVCASRIARWYTASYCSAMSGAS